MIILFISLIQGSISFSYGSTFYCLAPRKTDYNKEISLKKLGDFWKNYWGIKKSIVIDEYVNGRHHVITVFLNKKDIGGIDFNLDQDEDQQTVMDVWIQDTHVHYRGKGLMSLIYVYCFYKYHVDKITGEWGFSKKGLQLIERVKKFDLLSEVDIEEDHIPFIIEKYLINGKVNHEKVEEFISNPLLLFSERNTRRKILDLLSIPYLVFTRSS